MRRSWPLLLTFAIAGCTGFDEYYLHDPWIYETIAEPPCGCAGSPRAVTPPFASGPPPTISGSAPAPQSREPELLR